MSQNQPSQEVMDSLNNLVRQAAPFLAEVSKILRENGLHDFELNVGGKNSFYWAGGLNMKRSPNQTQLEEELLSVLNREYQTEIVSFMGMIYNPNRNVAQAIANIVSTHRAKDRREVAGQLIALMAAFEQGS